MLKTRVAVIRGGPSSEFDVSLRTGEGALSALDQNRYQPIDVVITRSGEWLLHGRSRDPHEIVHAVDVVFNALHGAYGEDGQVQRLLERANVPFTGSRSYPSALAMNKAITKDKVRGIGARLAKHFLVGKDAIANLGNVVRSIGSLFGPRYIVKPVNGGSSIGTSRADNEHELISALKIALEESDQAIVEEFISGREATCGVVEGLRDHELYALPAVEIRPPQHAGFFSEDVKYTGETEEICPGNFSMSEKKEIESLACLVHEALGLSHYSRSDFIVAPDGIYFLEVNTLPGLTEQSLMPKALSAVGISYPHFIEHLIERALQTR